MTRCDIAFRSLHDLHVKGIAHGDARLPNLLSCGTGDHVKLVWIDLRECVELPTPELQLRDAKTLAASVIGIHQGNPIPVVVNTALSKVSVLNVETYAELAKVVWRELSR